MCGGFSVEVYMGRTRSLSLYRSLYNARFLYHRRDKMLAPDRLSFDTFVRLADSDCVYCGSPPKLVWRKQLIYQGIDREDNGPQYTETNSVPCCTLCNRFKSDLTVEEFLEHVRRIAFHQHDI